MSETGETYCCAADLAAAWWEQQVVPVVRTWRKQDDVDEDQPDLQVFVAALARRDGLGRLDWDDSVDSQVPCC